MRRIGMDRCGSMNGACRFPASTTTMADALPQMARHSILHLTGQAQMRIAMMSGTSGGSRSRLQDGMNLNRFAT